MVQPDGQRVRVGRDALHQETRPVRGVGQRHLHVGVLRKRLRPLAKDAAACGVEAERSLLEPPQPPDHVRRVADDERRRVHQEPTTLLRLDRQRGEHRRRKRVAHVLDQRRLGVRRAEVDVLLNGVDVRTRSLEPENRLAGHAPIQAQLDRARRLTNEHVVEDVLTQPIDLEEQPSRRLVEVEGNEAVDPLQANRPLRETALLGPADAGTGE